MRLNRLRLCNFRQHIDTSIEFDTGITGIIGPNGSGKSTILEAIAWALYGMPAARGTRESIRAYKAGPRASVRVELDFELGGHRYLVTRGLTNAELFLDGSSQAIATSISGVTELLRRRLGMSHEEFFNTYFTGQKELSVMAAMGPAERAQFLSRVLGYERLRTAQGLVRQRRNTVSAEAAGLRAAMPDAEIVARAVAEARTRLAAADERAQAAADRRASARATLEELTPRWESLQGARELLHTLAAELRVADSERSSFQRDSDRIGRELAEAATAREEVARLNADLEPLAELQRELQALDRALAEEGRRRTLSEQVSVLSDELASLAERRTQVESAPVLESELTEALTLARVELEQAQQQFEALHTDWVRDRQEAETKRQALVEQLLDATRQREQIVELGEGGICPTCARPLGTHFRSVLEFLDSQLETITVDGKYYRARMEQLEETPAEVKALDERRRAAVESVARLERKLAKVQSAVQEYTTLLRDFATKRQRLDTVSRELATITVGYEGQRHAAVRRALERLAPLAARAARLTAQLERQPQLEEEGSRVRAQVARVDLRIAELTTRRAAVPFSEEGFSAMRSSYERAAAELRTAELASVAGDADAAAARAALESAEQARAELARNEAQLAVLVRERRLHDELDRAYTDLRTDLNLQLRPDISDRASRYIHELTDGRYAELELDDQYNVIVLEDGVPKPVISGGEEDLANLVLRLAISEMIAERAGQPFSLLILDEVFGSLDDVRRHNVVDLLRRLQDRFEQVILITHIETVREGLDRVVAVRYDEEAGISRVEAEEAQGRLELAEHAGAAD